MLRIFYWGSKCGKTHRFSIQIFTNLHFFWILFLFLTLKILNSLEIEKSLFFYIFKTYKCIYFGLFLCRFFLSMYIFFFLLLIQFWTWNIRHIFWRSEFRFVERRILDGITNLIPLRLKREHTSVRLKLFFTFFPSK